MLLDFTDEAEKGQVIHRASMFLNYKPRTPPGPYHALKQNCVHMYLSPELERFFFTLSLPKYFIHMPTPIHILLSSRR